MVNADSPFEEPQPVRAHHHHHSGEAHRHTHQTDLAAIEQNRIRVITIESIYLLVLFAVAVVYLTIPNSVMPPTLGALPIGVPWFGALGAVVISLTGAFDHQADWNPKWDPWHYARPLVGIALSIVSWLIFQAGILAVGANPPAPTLPADAAQAATAPTNLLYYVIAFVVGYREATFRELIKRVTDIILSPGQGPGASAAFPLIDAIDPPAGNIAGGDRCVITGSGFTGTTGVKFGSAGVPALHVDSDGQITLQTPPGTAGKVTVTVTTAGGNATTDGFTYRS